MLAQAVEHLIKNIVDFPDDVSVKSHENARGELIRVRVNPEDVASSDAADARQMRFAPWCRHCPTTRCASTSWTCAGEILAWCVICILTTLNSPSC